MAEPMSQEHASSWYDDAPITNEQIEVVRRDLASGQNAAFGRFAVRKLLAEVDRLRAQLARVGEYRVEADGDYEGDHWPYLEHVPCEQALWYGRYADGSGLDVATLLTLIEAHRCPKDGDRG